MADTPILRKLPGFAPAKALQTVIKGKAEIRAVPINPKTTPRQRIKIKLRLNSACNRFILIESVYDRSPVPIKIAEIIPRAHPDLKAGLRLSDVLFL
jgi:hypothetical protein